MTAGAQIARVMGENGMVSTLRRARLIDSRAEMAFAREKRGLDRPWSWARIAEVLGRNEHDVRRCCDPTWIEDATTVIAFAKAAAEDQLRSLPIRPAILRCVSLGLSTRADFLRMTGREADPVSRELSAMRKLGLIQIVNDRRGKAARWELTAIGQRKLDAMASTPKAVAHG